MNARLRSSWLSWSGAALVFSAVLVPAPVFAQAGAGDGYLFHRPQASMSLRLGVARPSETGKLFEFTRDNLMVNKGDFTSFSMGADLDIAVTSRLAVQFGATVAQANKLSEDRNFIDNNDLPIEQTTSFRRSPVTLGLKYYLTSPGASLGRYAWVPNRIAPYVAAGGGLMHYRFRQSGDFVDYQTLDVFNTTLSSSGWSGTSYVSGGAVISLSARMGLVTEARYDRARAPLGTDFQGFDRIDLSGVSVTTGLHLRF